MTITYLWLVPVLPLAGFLVNGLLRLPRPAAALVGCSVSVASFVASLFAVAAYASHGGAVEQRLFEWITVGPLTVDVAFRVDALSAVMILVVTGVGSLIHVYAVAYMHDDPGFSRFFAYLNLFMFSMLVLVLGDSLPLMFLGWEGVGLCSYLLIGFWYKDLKNADAGRKAFIVNRVGDFGFLLGIFCVWQLFGTLQFADMKALPEGSETLAWAAALLLFLGATGKSAQIPLYVWLPDAMAGPTPVSALIHAATMVTAGVYMIGRMGVLFLGAPEALAVVGLVAALTALLAGAIAVAQNDIKKVLAYSTVSQLGFMFAGMSTGMYTTGLFHVVTHAFFKALLFLGAGAVIHALHGEQDIRKMGGLGRKLPVLTGLFLAGGLALAGFPFTSGFFSKDAILAAVFANGQIVVGSILVVTAGLTAFYTTRLCIIVFGPKPHEEHGHGHGEPHELHKPGLLMLVPLAVLALLSLFGGVLTKPIERWLAPAWNERARIEAGLEALRGGDDVAQARAAIDLARLGDPALAAVTAAGLSSKPLEDALHRAHALHLRMMVVSAVVFLLGAGSAFLLYTKARATLARWVEGPLRGLHRAAENKFWVDELYEVLIVAPLRMGVTVAWFVVDRLIIDGLFVNGAGRLVYLVGGALRRPHTGSLNAALATFVVGAVLLLGWLLWKLGALDPRTWASRF